MASPLSRTAPAVKEYGKMHYPRRISKVKRARKQGFRARMRRPGGRKLISRKRRRGCYKVSVC